MSSTNKTTNYNLSQFLGSDKPAWLVDYNGDMSAIDTQMKANADAAAAAQSTANGADGKADTNAGAIETLNTQINGASGIAADVSTLQGAVNTINSLIGNGEPTTTDKTLIGAINEIDADVNVLNAAKNQFVYFPTFLQVSIEGLTTFSDLAGAIITAINNHLAALGEHRGMRLRSLRFTGLEEVYTETTYRYSHGDTFSSADFSAITCGSTSMKLSSLHLAATPRYQHVDIASDGTVTYSGIAAETIASLGITGVYVMFDRLTELV